MSVPARDTIIRWPASWVSMAAMAVCALFFLIGLPALLTRPLEEPWISLGVVLFGLGIPVLWIEGVGRRVRFGPEAFVIRIPLVSRSTIPYAEVIEVNDDAIRTERRTISLPRAAGAKTAAELRRRMAAAGFSPEDNLSAYHRAQTERWKREEAERLRHLAPQIELYRDVALAPRLARALRSADLPALRRALEDGATPNARDAKGLTPLMRAAEREWVAGVRELLNAGADPHALTSDGWDAADMVDEIAMGAFSVDGNKVIALINAAS